MTPLWFLDVLAALTLVVAVVSAARVVAARPWQAGSVIIDTDVAHVLMGIAMAGVLAASLATLPDIGWEIVFALLTAWFAVRAARDARQQGIRALGGGRCAPHLAHSAAMLFMFLAVVATPMAAMPDMAGMSGGTILTVRNPTLTFVFALILVGYAVWDLDQLSGGGLGLVRSRGVPAKGVLAGATAGAGSVAYPAQGEAPAGPDGAGILLSPRVTVGCRIAMGVTMVLMLIIMI